MPRQSTRLKTKVPRQDFVDPELDVEFDDKDDEDDDADEDVEDDEDDEEFKAKQTRKHRKTSHATVESLPRKARGNRGKLQQLTEFPLDVLFEIFGHLRPLDVLHLARTTKALRGVLMRRSAISVWKQARANDAIPDCPFDLTEPQYANLAFDPYCHFCLAPHVPNVFWGCRVRCCKKCFPENFLNDFDIGRKYPHLLLDLTKFLSSCNQMVQRRRRGPTMYCVRQIQALVDEYTQIEGTERMPQWMEEKKNALQERTLHANLCETWHRQRGFLRSLEIDDIRQKRKEAIYQKLEECGWGKEVELLDFHGEGGLLSHALVRQGKELTERIWNNIKSTLIEFMQAQKEARIKTSQRQCLTVLAEMLAHEERKRSLDFIPGVADIALMAPFRTAIESPTTVSRDCFTKAMKELPQLIQQWKSSKDQELVKLMGTNNLNGASECSEKNLAGLELASTFFKCSVCSDPISYPRILGHEHMSRYFPNHACQAEDGFTEMLSSCYYRTWNYGKDRVKFHDFAYNVARSVVQACGLDPDTATARDMDKAKHVVECLHCREADGTRFVMRWRWAVYHATLRHDEASSYSWLLLSPKDKELASQKEVNPFCNFDTPTQLSTPSPVKLFPVQPRGGS